jgi:predicted TIM-barrel fold metal-dependent hydrolase
MKKPDRQNNPLKLIFKTMTMKNSTGANLKSRREFITSTGKLLGATALTAAVAGKSEIIYGCAEQPELMAAGESILIDIHIHTHLPTKINVPAAPGARLPTPAELIKWMNESGISKCVILPLVSPECRDVTVTTEESVEIWSQYPDRLIPFCNIDPRYISNSPKANLIPLLNAYKEAGCKGVGEYFPNIALDDPLNMNVFSQVEEAGLPLLFHLAPRVGGYYGCYDDAGLPRLEKVLKQYPKLTFLGHSQVFWAEIGVLDNPDDRGGYPQGPIKKEGRLVELMRNYPNLWGDLSAGSGHNAIARDPEFGYRFLEEFQDRLCFGTDYCHIVQDVPQIPYFRKLKEQRLISETAYDKITWKNVGRLLQV